MNRKYKDISLNFTPNPVTGDVSLVSDEKAISQSIRNIILTDKYEVPFNPNFGGNIRNLLFELISPFVTSDTRARIITAIENYEPRAEIVDVYVTETRTGDGIDITIAYRAKTSTENIIINFFLSRII